MVNILVTGSQKYGKPNPSSDIDVVIFCSQETSSDVWAQAWLDDENARKCVFWQVALTYDPCELAEVNFGVKIPEEILDQYLIKGVKPPVRRRGVDVRGIISNEDQKLLAGLYKWLPAQDGHGFSCTGRNDLVNLVPVHDPDLFKIWQDGTEALVELAKQGIDCNRDFAIDLFTDFGLPRLEDS